MSDQTSAPLNTGSHIPLLGYGTWRAPDDQVTKAVELAIRNGVRHIDCAWAYDNEEAVGRGIRAAGLGREELFVTTKLWGTYHRRVEEGLDSSLKRLGLDYIDLFLVHWPIALHDNGQDKIPLRQDGSRDIDQQRSINDTWSDMEALLKTMKVKAIGVSNMSQTALDKLLTTAKVVPAANQIESHPFLPEHDLVRFLHDKGIVPEAYSPLGSGVASVLQDETIIKIARKHNVDPAQVAISWQVQRGVAVLPKSVTESRIISNAKVITLSRGDMTEIDDIHKQKGKHVRTCHPPWGVDLHFSTGTEV